MVSLDEKGEEQAMYLQCRAPLITPSVAKVYLEL